MKNPVFFLLLLTTTTGSVAASQFSVSASLLHFDYTEYSFGSTLNSENGLLPGIQLTLQNTISEHIATRIMASAYSGELDYNGTTRFGMQHQTISNTQLQGLGAEILYRPGVNTKLSTGLNYHSWRRDIETKNSVFGLREKYRWLEISAGVQQKLWQQDKDQLQAKLALTYSYNPRLHVDLSSADLGTTELRPTSKYGRDIELEWLHTVDSSAHYSINVFYRYRELGESESSATTGGSSSILLSAPETETTLSGIDVSYIMKF